MVSGIYEIMFCTMYKFKFMKHLIGNSCGMYSACITQNTVVPKNSTAALA
jgi:hypothetical protein